MIETTRSARSILAVFAHPDDESLACGGTLARLASAGFRVIVVSATHGERGGPIDTRKDDELGHARALEIREAAAALRRVRSLHRRLSRRRFAMGPCRRISRRAGHAHTPPPSGRRDHVWRGRSLLAHGSCRRPRANDVSRPVARQRCARRSTTSRCRTGVMTEIVATARRRGWVPPPRGFWSLEPEAFGIAARPATITVDVSDWIPRKLAAILCHRSQMVDGHPFAQLCDADARRLLGMEYFHRANIETAAPPVLERL